MGNKQITNVLTIDVEDYFQVSALAKSISRDDWNSISPRVVDNTKRLLDMFDQHDVKATHFVLGWVAERFPDLIREIHSRGHEVASHGYSHQLIYNQSPEVFQSESRDSKKMIEDIIGTSVFGYRAASYSITRKSLWALDILADLGFTYDSSIFPVVHDRYGIKGSPEMPHVLSTPKKQRLVEYPLSTYRIFNQTIPVAGGGYFRLYPYALSRYFYRNINRSSDPFVFYLHPWEIDPGQPRVNTSLLSRFRHYNNLDKCQMRLSNLLSEFSFTTMMDKLNELDLFNKDKAAAIQY
jgi:polysaccharide deacetylase family protein (PEP-CTERM system associated)